MPYDGFQWNIHSLTPFGLLPIPHALWLRYLCDFAYYTSLYQSHGRSAFVHVPPLGKPYNADQLGRALQAIIEEMLDVLEQSEGKLNRCHKH